MTYDAYKPSGIEWIGDVPEHWEVKKMKYVTDINSSDYNYVDYRSTEKTVVFLPMEKISEKGELQQELRKKANEVATGFTYFEKGDIIVAKITPCFENGKGAYLDNLETEFGYGSTEFHVIRPTNTDGSFVFYITKSNEFMALGEASMTGAAGQKRVPTSFIKEYYVAYPPLAEQQAIAAYLDEKTTQLDTYVTHKQALIALLKEERAGLINQYLSTESNRTKRLKYVVVKIGSGVTPSGGASAYQKSGIPLLRSQNIHFDRLRLDDVAYISEEVHQDMSNSQVMVGDVLLNITGASIGRCFYVDSTLDEANVNQHVCIIRPKSQILTKYLYMLLASELGQEQIRRSQTGANREGLNFEQLKNFAFHFPSLTKQAEIVARIEQETGRIDEMIGRIERELSLLSEYRTALISEVVTGKVRVA